MHGARIRLILLIKKTISLVLILQLAIPPSFVRAVDSDDEEQKSRSPSPHHFLNDSSPPSAAAAPERVLAVPSASSSSAAASSSSSALSGDPAVGTAPAARTVNPLIKRIKALYSAQDTLPKLIDDESVPQQRMEDYYVTLQILLEGKGVGEKRPIELKQLFDKVEDQDATGHVLIVGTPGIGKTTFLHHMAYEWAQGRVFADKFDSVFTVKLKKLTTDPWKAMRASEDNLLENLIYDSLDEQRDGLPRNIHGKVEKILKQDVLGFLSDEGKRLRTLLLLDGYDEVYHLNRKGSVTHKIINEIFEYPNVVLTSRHSGVDRTIQEGFARKIESQGFNQEGVLTYINRYFGNHLSELEEKAKSALLSLYERNPTLKETLTTPLNAAMICLVSASPGFVGKFSGDFSMGQLYKEVLVWLGKRYMIKFRDKNVKEVDSDDVFELDEVKVLGRIAYKAFKKGELSMKGEDIKKHIRKANKDLQLSDVLKFGLLKTDGSDAPLTQMHAFIHFSFQEYMVARFLQNSLMSPNEVEMRRAARSIGEHRNEPKYLMILKFLAGMVSDEEERAKGAQVVTASSGPPSREPSSLLTQFWEAVTCNVDGVLELGVETKVKLLMHLLGQSKVGKNFDARIPNLHKIIAFIDDVILKDIAAWGEHIIQSGYLSPRIVGHLKGIMAKAVSELSSRSEGQGAASAASASAAAPVPAAASSSKAAPAAESPSPSLKIEADQKREQEAETQKLKTAMEVISSLPNRPELREEGEQDGRLTLFNNLMALVKYREDWHVKKLALQKLNQITDQTLPEGSLKTCLTIIVPFLKNSNLEKVVRDFLVMIIKTQPTLQPTLAGEAFNHLKSLFFDSNEYVKLTAHMSVREVVKGAPSVVGEALNLLKPLLSNSDYNINSSAEKSLGDVMKAVQTDHALDLLVPLLSNDSYSMRRSVAHSLREIVNSVPEAAASEVAAKALDMLQPLLSTPNKYIQSSAIEALEEIVKGAPEGAVKAEVAAKAFLLLESRLFDNEEIVKNAANRSLDAIVKCAPAVANKFFELLKPLLFHDNENIRVSAAQRLQEMVAALEVAVAAFGLLKSKLSDVNWKVKVAVVESLAKVVEGAPGMIDQVLGLLTPLLEKGVDEDVKFAAVKSLIEIMRCAPKVADKVADKVLELLPPLLSSNYEKTKITSAKSLRDIAEMASEKPEKVLKLLEPLLSDPCKEVRGAAVEGLGEVAKKELVEVGKVLDLLETRLSDKDWFVKYLTVKNLARLVKGEALAMRALHLLTPLLRYDDKYDHYKYDHYQCLRSATAEGLGEVVEKEPAVADAALQLLKHLLSANDKEVEFAEDESSNNKVRALKRIKAMRLSIDPEVKTNAVKSLRTIATVPAPTVADEAFEMLKNFLFDDDAGVKSVAAESLGRIVQAKPKRADEILALLKEVLLKFNDSNIVISAAVQSLGEVARLLSFDTVARMLTDEVPAIREHSAKVLLEKLKNPICVEKFVYTDTLTLLRIVETAKGAEETKELSLAAKNTLEHLAGKMNDEGVAWITARFDQLPKSPQTNSFLKDVCHKILKSGEITPAAKEFFIKCIQNGLTTSVIRDGKVIFDGTPYWLSENSKQHFDGIIQAALNQPDDLLAEQYRTHQPLFPNTGSGLRMAASDIPEVLDLTGRKLISHQKWLLTSLSTLETRDALITLETRSPFGDRVAYMLDAEGCLLVRAGLHPYDFTRDVRERIFGTLDASTYHASSVFVSKIDARELLACTHLPADPTFEDHYGEEANSHRSRAFKGLLSNLLKASPSVTAAEASLIPSFKKAIVPYNVTKIDLLGLDPLSLEAGQMKHEIMLRDARVPEKAAIAKGFAAFSQHPDLRLYCQTFYWTMMNLFNAYRALSSGVLQGDLTYGISTTKSLLKSGANSAVNSGAKYAAQVLEGIPLVGGVIGALTNIVNDVHSTVKKQKIANDANIIVRIFEQKFGILEEDISLSLSKAALAITHARQEEIQAPPPVAVQEGAAKEAMKSAKSWLQEKMGKVQQKVLPVIEARDTQSYAVQLALKDGVAMTAYLLAHYKEIIENEDKLEVQMEILVRNGSLDALLAKAEAGNEGSALPAAASPKAASPPSQERQEQENPLVQNQLGAYATIDERSFLRDHFKAPAGPSATPSSL